MLKRFYQFLHPKYQTLFLEYKVSLKPRYGYGNPPHNELYNIINSGRNDYKEMLEKALKYKNHFWYIRDSKNEKNPANPAWNNGFMPGLDMVALYTMISEIKPKKYVEIGSGNSTKVVFKSKTEQNLDTKIVSIDPAPRAEIDNLADTLIPKPLEDVDINGIISEMEKGDILFVDNSHRILPNSDSMVLFLEILPRLKKGIIVHIHDIYLPYDYPQFMCDRFYSEQYGLAICLLANPQKFKIILPNYFISQDKELSEIISPVWDHPHLTGVEKHGGSFWIEIN